MTKTAWVFPGQGSQTIGMGLDLLDLPVARARFAQADHILGWSVAEICQSEADEVSQTCYTQPCLYVIETLLADLLKARGYGPDYVAGHSLGEYPALYAAGVFDFETGLRLIQQRAVLMDQARDGAMAALLNCDRAALDAMLAQTADVVLANDNNAGQVVISGTPTAVEAVMQQVKARKAIRLNVSGAFHSPLMAEAATQFSAILEPTEFYTAKIPVLSNTDPTPSTDATALKIRLHRQITGTVRWREISLTLAQQGVSRVVEVGPGKVLTGIIKRTCADVTFQTIGQITDLPDPVTQDAPALVQMSAPTLPRV